ncbi:MAG: alginate export family protein, partial [Desulfobacteraceae bacterium]|nr:alginate export family protein [Desulfobacteraceae bacterium]
TEPRYYHRPASMDKQFTHNEALFDRLNFTWRNVFDLPMKAIVGRQEIKLGSNWLLIDGTPLDGARTNFFDAIRLTYDLEDRNTTTDLIWVENHGDSAKWLKPFDDQDIDLAEQDEQGAILYLSKRTSQDSKIDGYFIYKHDRNRNRNSGYEGEIYTLGTMLEGKLDKRWKYRVEFAPQFGHKNGKELNAFATNNQLTYHFNDSKNNRVYVGYEYLSGDDDPDKYFDKVWGRVDTWSVLHQGSIDSIDGRQIDSSNLHRVHFGWLTEPTDKTKIQTTYHLLFADDNTLAGGTGGLSKSGNFRGQLLRAQIKYKVNEHIYHRLEGELFLPGDFYNNDRNDVAVFVRYGIVFTW